MSTHLKHPGQCSHSCLQRDLVSEYFHHLKYCHGNGNIDIKIKLIELEIAGNIYIYIYIYICIYTHTHTYVFSILDSSLRNKFQVPKVYRGDLG